MDPKSMYRVTTFDTAQHFSKLEKTEKPNTWKALSS